VICVVVVAMVTLTLAAPQQGPFVQRIAQRFGQGQFNAVADRFQQELCSGLSQQECQNRALTCGNVRRSLKLVDNPSLVRNCATQFGINPLELLANRDPSKTLDEVLASVGARRDQIRSVQTCVFTQAGLVRNGVLDVNAVKNSVRPKIQASISNFALQAAILRALDACPQPTIDSLREFRRCIAKTCINNA